MVCLSWKNDASQLILAFTVAHSRYLIDPTPTVESASTAALNNIDPDDAAEGSTSRPHFDGRDARNNSDGRDDRDNKRRKTNRKDKERTGQNKGRHFPTLRENAVKICRAWETTGTCARGADDCKWAHSWDGYFGVKPADIHFESRGALKGEPDYTIFNPVQIGGEDEIGRTLDLGTECPVWKDLGYCPYAWRCRFLGAHIKRLTPEEKADGKESDVARNGDWECLGMGSIETEATDGWKRDEKNWPDSGVLQALRTYAVSRLDITVWLCS